MGTRAVGPRDALETRSVAARRQLAGRRFAQIPLEGLEIHAKVRSTRPPRPATLYAGGDDVRVSLAEGEAGIAPGQACVFYSGDGDEARVLGGGFIERSERGRAAEEMLSRRSAMPAGA